MGFLDMGSKSDAYKCKNCNKNFKEPIRSKSGKCKACRTKEDKEEDDERSSRQEEEKEEKGGGEKEEEGGEEGEDEKEGTTAVCVCMCL